MTNIGNIFNHKKSLDVLVSTGKRKYDRLTEFFYMNVAFLFDDVELEWIMSHKLDTLEENMRHYLRDKITQGLKSLQDTTSYKTLERYGIAGKKADETMLVRRLKTLRTQGLVALALLGDMKVFPDLVIQLNEEKVGKKTYRDTMLVLKYLTGRNLPLYNHPKLPSSWIKWWEQNKLAFEMAPQRTRFKLLDIEELSIVLEKIGKAIDDINNYAVTYEKYSLRVRSDTEQAKNDLLLWTLYLGFQQFWDFPYLDQKIPVKQWVNDLAEDFQDKRLEILYKTVSGTKLLLGQPKANFMPPTNIQNVQIWRNADTFYLEGKAVTRGYLYWNDLYSHLDSWRKLSGAVLETIDWQVKEETIKFITVWYLPLQTVKELDVSQNEQDFWKIDFQPVLPTHMSILSNASLLNTQLLARRGGNWLLPITLPNKRLAIELKIPRADVEKSRSPAYPLSKTVIEEVAWHILNPMVPHYTKISLRLEDALRQDIDRIRSFIPDYHQIPEYDKTGISIPYFDNIEREKLFYLEDALEELVWLREMLTRHWKNLKSAD